MTENNNSSQSNPGLNIAILIIIIGGLMLAESIVNQILMAFFVSIICARPILWLQGKKVPQSLAIAIVFIAFISIFVGFSELIGSSLSSFSNDVNKYEANLNKMSASFLHFIDNYGIDLSSGSFSNMFEPTKIMGFTASFLSQLGGFMGNTLTILFLVLFLLMELDSIPIKMSAIVDKSTKSLSYFSTIGNSIRHYLSIKTATSMLTGALIWISLSIVGLDYAILWALIAFLLNYIPNIGSIIAAIPAILFALIQLGIGGVVWTTIIFVAVNLLIGNVVEPKWMGKGLGLSTFVVFLSLIFWGFVLGAVGMFLSVPLTMTIKIILEQNPRTKGIAILLGTEGEAQLIVDKKKENS